MLLKSITLYIILIIILFRIYSIEKTDRTHPFGSDNSKLEKYAKIIGNNDYKSLIKPNHGVSTFWGIPDKSDSLLLTINKIRWLAHSSHKETMWRWIMITAILLVIIVVPMIGFEFFKIRFMLILVFISFLVVYMSKSYEKTHFIQPKLNYLDHHVKKLKRKLKLSQDNSIKDYNLL